MELLADIMRPALREADFNTEKQVILEEIQMYQDQPPFGMDDRCKALHFAHHPLGHSVLGTLDSVGALPVEAMRDYFQRRYCPSNIALVATGQVDFDALVKLAEQHCGAWQPATAPRDIRPAADHRAFECVKKDGVTQQYAIQIANAPSATEPRASRPSSWPRSWETTRAAGYSGRWSILVWPNMPAWVTTTTREPACT